MEQNTEQPAMELHPIFMKQGEYLAQGDLDGLMSLYHDDAVWIRFQGVVVGKENIREKIAKYWEQNLEFVEMNEYIHNDDTIMVRSTMKVNGEVEVAFGIYVIRDGKIWRQTGAVEGGMRDFVS